MNHYDALGVPRDASLEEIRHAYLTKAAQLRPERFAGAPDNVLAAIKDAEEVIDEAWRVLGDPSRRIAYDSELGPVDSTQPNEDWLRAEHIWVMERELGWPLSPVLGFEPPEVPPLSGVSTLGPGADKDEPADSTSTGGLAGQISYPSREGNVSPIFAGLEAFADWLAPRRRTPRDVRVPDVCGMRASDAFYAVATADLHIHFVRLTENPTGGDGTVVAQDPPAGTSVRRRSTLTVQVVHPTPIAGVTLD